MSEPFDLMADLVPEPFDLMASLLAEPSDHIYSSLSMHIPLGMSLDIDDRELSSSLMNMDSQTLHEILSDIQNLTNEENKLFQELHDYEASVRADLTNSGFVGLINNRLPEPTTTVFVPPVLEKSKRPTNVPKDQKSILSEWFMAHLDKPYPSDADKAELSSRTGMPVRQITTWFQNARTRILPKIREQELTQADAKRPKTQE